MKSLKILMVALVWLVLPAAVFGQKVSCDVCTHVASVFMGEGGVIATADDTDEVTWVATCGGITRSDTLEADDDGVVAALWAGDLACMDKDGGTFKIGPVMDGGWFWLTDESNSAVGGLVNMDILDNPNAEITEAGEGVTMMKGKGAVYLKQASTGRVGILPNILPEPPADPAAVCGPRANDDFPNAYDSQAVKNCMLGTGRTKIRLLGPGRFGNAEAVTNGMVYRPKAGTVTVYADLWVDESGSYSTATDNDTTDGPSTESIQKGWAGKTATASGSGSGTNWLTATFGASVDATVGAPVTVPSDGSEDIAGVTQTNTGETAITPGGATEANPVGQAVFTIGPDSAYCSKTNNHAAVVNIAATPAASDDDPTNNIHPPVATGRAAGLGRTPALQGFAAITQLRVVCPPASSAANKGRELVPENPFPVDE